MSIARTSPEQTLMFAEASEAGAVATRQARDLTQDVGSLGRTIRDLDPPVVITCARGSSDHAATYAKYLIETRARTPVASHAPSVSSVYGAEWRKLSGALFLAISQSGRSPDLIVSAKAARDAGAYVVAIVNDADSPLAETAELTLPMLAGAERSVAATKSHIASLLLIARIVAAWTEDAPLHEALAAAPAVLDAAWALDWSPALGPLSSASSLFVLGRGLTLGAAQEAALKLKEVCGLHAEAYSAAEVRHGPMAIVGPGFPVLMFPPNDDARDAFIPLAEEFAGRDSRVFVAGEAPSGTLRLPVLPGLHPALAPIAQIQSFYRLAAALSIARGLDPDSPPHLRKITRTR